MNSKDSKLQFHGAYRHYSTYYGSIGVRIKDFSVFLAESSNSLFPALDVLKDPLAAVRIPFDISSLYRGCISYDVVRSEATREKNIFFEIQELTLPESMYLLYFLSRFSYSTIIILCVTTSWPPEVNVETSFHAF